MPLNDVIRERLTYYCLWCFFISAKAREMRSTRSRVTNRTRFARFGRGISGLKSSRGRLCHSPPRFSDEDAQQIRVEPSAAADPRHLLDCGWAVGSVEDLDRLGENAHAIPKLNGMVAWVSGRHCPHTGPSVYESTLTRLFASTSSASMRADILEALLEHPTPLSSRP